MTENAFPYKTEGHRHRPEIEQELAALGSPAPVTFVPHLLPLDQGELATCFAAAQRADLQGGGPGALPRALRRRSPSSASLDGPPGPARRARHQRVPRLRHGRGARPGDRLLGDRQHLEGRLRPGRAEPQPDARASTRRRGSTSERASGDASSARAGSSPGRGRGARPRPAGARLPRRRRPLRAQGRRQDRRRPARLRRRGGQLGDAADPQRLGRGADPGLPRRASTAAAVRAAVVNSGNANAETGEQGLRRRAGDVRAGGRGARARARAGRRRRDRDDRRAAADRRRPRRDRRGRRGPLGRRRRRLLRGDPDHRPLAEALHAAGRRRDPLGPGEGRGDDRAELRDDALLRPDRRRRRGPRRGACAPPSTPPSSGSPSTAR